VPFDMLCNAQAPTRWTASYGFWAFWRATTLWSSPWTSCSLTTASSPTDTPGARSVAHALSSHLVPMRDALSSESPALHQGRHSSFAAALKNRGSCSCGGHMQGARPAAEDCECKHVA